MGVADLGKLGCLHGGHNVGVETVLVLVQHLVHLVIDIPGVMLDGEDALLGLDVGGALVDKVAVVLTGQ